jgi:hypothetical protein
MAAWRRAIELALGEEETAKLRLIRQRDLAGRCGRVLRQARGCVQEGK